MRVRSALKAGLERLLRHKGYEPQIKVLNAYKPGLSWLLEEILPELQKRSSLRSVEFRYKPDAPAGKTLEMNSREGFDFKGEGAFQVGVFRLAFA